MSRKKYMLLSAIFSICFCPIPDFFSFAPSWGSPVLVYTASGLPASLLAQRSHYQPTAGGLQPQGTHLTACGKRRIHFQLSISFSLLWDIRCESFLFPPLSFLSEGSLFFSLMKSQCDVFCLRCNYSECRLTQRNWIPAARCCLNDPTSSEKPSKHTHLSLSSRSLWLIWHLWGSELH